MDLCVEKVGFLRDQISWIRKSMFLINTMVIVLFFYIISYTTGRISQEFHAREFIERAQYLPLEPEKMLAFALGFLVALGISNLLKARFLMNVMVIRGLLILDFFFCFMIVYYMNFGYKGIYLILMMNVFLHTKENVFRIWVLGAALVFFILSDYDMFAGWLKILSIQDYVVYNSPEIRFYMLAGKNVLTSLNEIGFIVFLYFLLRNKINENKAIMKLNEALKSTATQLQLANIQLKDYAITLEENTKMKERNRLAREIHDILGHSLTSIATGLEAGIELLGLDPLKAKVQLEKLLELSRKGLLDVRRSVKELKVDRLLKSEFIPAIRGLVNDINDCTPVRVTLNIEGNEPNLKEDEEQIIYRIIQESLTNAIRHGKASHIDLLLTFKGYDLTIVVADDGKGCEMVSEGFGLTHIREWLQLLSGELSYETASGAGFKLMVHIPIRWGQAYD